MTGMFSSVKNQHLKGLPADITHEVQFAHHGGEPLSLRKQLFNVFCVSEGNFMKSEKINVIGVTNWDLEFERCRHLPGK